MTTFDYYTEMDNNILLDTDSYKASHWLQYPDSTEGMFSYLESRGGAFTNTVFFGLQYILEQYLIKPITITNVKDAADFYALHGVPFNYEGFENLVAKHNGNLPISIKAVPEGSVIPTGNILMSVESTDPEFYWLVSYLETMLMRLWYPTTVATLSWNCKQMMRKYLDKTSDTLSHIDFMLHDFGSRGVSSRESAGIGGAAHLVNFMGSDTVWGINLANHFYEADMSAYSIPASEHSTMTALGEAGESIQMERMVDKFSDDHALVAVVSDSYDIYRAVNEYWGGLLKEKVQRCGATIVIRPDSGDPMEVVPQILLDLEKHFGSSTNSKGYGVLNNVKVIQGDGMDYVSIKHLLNKITSLGFSACNLSFGMGGGLLQKVNRDTQRFAYKCSALKIDGVWKDVYKNPVTDPGKVSKKGRLALQKIDGKYVTVREDECMACELKEVFRDGKILQRYSLNNIRERAKEFKS